MWDCPFLRSVSWLICIRFCHELSAAIWRGNLPWLFAVGTCRGYLPQVFAVGFFYVCKQTCFLWEQIFFLCKQTFFICKQNIFLFMRIPLITVFLFAIAMAVTGHRRKLLPCANIIYEANVKKWTNLAE